MAKVEDDSKSAPLLSGDQGGDPPWEDQSWWRFTHAFAFVLGGTTFWFGTLSFYYPNDLFFGLDQGNFSAWLYIIGSAGFLYVDVLEFFTFTEDKWLRVNISMSMTGSTLYLIGSAGFLPVIYAANPEIGIQGFIWGSFAIGTSQLWKVYRINKESEGGIFGSKDSMTATGVEGGAQWGAMGFFFGTIVYYYIQNALEGPLYSAVLAMWMFGATFFTVGGLFLSYRHAIMGV